jgi:hypothetical protein
MLRSLGNVLGVNPGFHADHVLSMHVRLPDRAVFEGRAVGRLQRSTAGARAQLPGVESAAVASGLPMMDNLSVTTYRVEGEAPPADPAQTPETDTKGSAKITFRTIGTPILRGRGSPGRTPRRKAPLW